MSKILNKIKSPEDIKKLSIPELKQLAKEIRKVIISVTSKKGGHIAASLGTVELAIAMHYCMESPKDKILWDVGHQSYAHKLLTGRADIFDTLREMGGISGFPNASESEHDTFTCGHSSTSISTALGLATARDLKGEEFKVAAVIGDAALSSGLAFEGLNHAGHAGTNLVVVLNDNEQSISKPVGAMSKYLNKIITNPVYNRFKGEAEKIVKSIPKLGPVAFKTVKKFQEGVKNLLVPGIVFEELGFRYFGPIDGHNIEQLITTFRNVQNLKEPVFIHTITKKGKGYDFAEKNPETYHGVGPFNIQTGESNSKPNGEKTFTEHFGEQIERLATKDDRIVAVTAAMPEGTGLRAFQEKFPERFFDVGITEPHAVTFAAGLAKGGLIPVVAIYSTFLQRSYDQLIHDVALQKLPVVFCVDRAGLVGEDGPTHHGTFDISYARDLPGFIVMAPKDGHELELMLAEAVTCGKPVIIRYPKECAKSIVSPSSCTPVKIGTAERLRKGKHLTIIAIGSMVNCALKACDVLSKQGIEAAVINARFIKPLDINMLEDIAKEAKIIFTLEEGILSGGFGESIISFFEQENIFDEEVKNIGLPDEFIEHGRREELLRKYHLTPDEIAATIKLELGHL